MRKNKMMRLASGLLVAVLLTTSMISGTFAKYISEKSASDEARVAKWSFTVDGKDIAQEAFEFELFKTINDTGNTADESDVNDELIAPGTSGSFTLKLKNASEVSAKYKVVFAVDNSTPAIPLQFSVDGNTWVEDITELNISDAADATKLAANTAAEDIVVSWKWVFDADTDTTHSAQDDISDTQLGILSTNGLASEEDELEAPKIKVTATITATQVD